MADCWYLKSFGQKASGTRPNMLVANAHLPQVTMSKPPVEISTPSRPTDEYTPFISKATVSIPGSAGAQIPVVVLRDTGARKISYHMKLTLTRVLMFLYKGWSLR